MCMCVCVQPMRATEVTQHEMHFETHAARAIFILGRRTQHKCSRVKDRYSVCALDGSWLDQMEYLLFAFEMPTSDGDDDGDDD